MSVHVVPFLSFHDYQRGVSESSGGTCMHGSGARAPRNGEMFISMAHVSNSHLYALLFVLNSFF